ncbi:15150_t:CDS:1 [Gigaspora margarita]|uniref:15150_t:CDS:1 n=1 Tax=Gigaspora margarita TaxID=4874 RepID=A0ABN7W848_GIGMA|nr:15150_t:CDS:1 [Gigaspora margarita]
MSDLSQNPNWFHSDLLKTFVLNILNNSQGVKVRGINIEQYPCQHCNREIFSFHPIILLSCGHAFHLTCINFNLDLAICPKCPVQSEVRVEEFEISPKHKQKTNQFKDSRKFKKLFNEILNEATMQNTTQSHYESNTRLSIDFNDLNKKISNAEENYQTSIHEVLRRYYNLGKAIAWLYDHFYKITHDDSESRQKINQEFKRQLQIDTLDMALRKRKERNEKIFSLFSCFNTNEDKFKGREMINRIRSFSVSTISSLSWENINIVKSYIINELDRRNRQYNNRNYSYF